MINKCNPVLIVGLGKIGRFYARELAKQNYRIFGIDGNNEVVDAALANGDVIGASVSSDENLIIPCNLIILNIRPQESIKWLKDNKLKIAECTIIDCGCLNEEEVNKANELLGGNGELISTYPYFNLQDDELIKVGIAIRPTKDNSLQAKLIAHQFAKIMNFPIIKEEKFNE